MITRWLAARVRRAWIDNGGRCAMWVECRYMEPYGRARWAVIVHPIAGVAHEVARHRSLLVALWRARKEKDE